MNDSVYTTGVSRSEKLLQINRKDPSSGLLKTYSVPIKKFAAVRGSNLGDELYDNEILSVSGLYNVTMEKNRKRHSELGTMGAIGCYLSHTTLWKQLLESEKDGYFIFESDSVCRPYILEEIISIVQKQKDLDVLFLGLIGTNVKSPNVYRIKTKFYGTHAYYITRKGAEALLKYAFPIEQQIDSYMHEMNLLGLSDPNMTELYMYNYQNCDQQNAQGSSIQLKKVVCDEMF
jgi:GR25 family glycosyltransferase involved in LPS biosynthesis